METFVRLKDNRNDRYINLRHIVSISEAAYRKETFIDLVGDSFYIKIPYFEVIDLIEKAKTGVPQLLNETCA